MLFKKELSLFLPSCLIAIPPWLGSLLISLLIGFIIGALIKHFLKFGLILVVVVVVLLTLGYVATSSFELVLNLISPEVASIWKDSMITTASGIASSILFFLGLAIAVWKS